MKPAERQSPAWVGGALNWIAAVSMWLACLCLALLTLLFLAIIGLRVVGVAIPSADDVAVILLGGVLSLGFASVVPGDQHISVDFFVDHLGGGAGVALRILAAVVMILAVGYLAYGVGNIWWAAAKSGIKMLGTLPIPRALPMGIVLIGVVMLELALVLRFIERATGEGFGPSADPVEPE